MRIPAPNGIGTPTSSAPARKTQAGTFTEADTARPTSTTVAAKNVGGIDALLALQGVEDATERRRQSLRRGRLALDALDELKVALLGGELGEGSLAKLKSAALPPSNLDPGTPDL